MFQGQVNLSHAPIGQRDVGFYKQVEARKSASAETWPGPFGPGDGAPNVALLLREGAPTGGDGAENPADSDLSGGARIEWNKGRVADLAIARALPDSVPTFARFRIGHFHNSDAGPG